jgi:hypothetical protein
MAQKIAVLDPGHFTNHNRGAACGYWEGNFNLAYAFMLKTELEALGWLVYLTRTNGTDLSLTKRGQFAVSKHADLFYSIHSNACGTEAVRGVGAFYSVDRPSNKAFALLQAQIVAAIMGSPKAYANTKASTVYFSTPDPSTLEDYYTVIDSSSDGGVPHIILLEHDFHTNKAVCKWLSGNADGVLPWVINAAHCTAMAKAEAANIHKFYGDPSAPPPPVSTGDYEDFTTTAACYTV